MRKLSLISLSLFSTITFAKEYTIGVDFKNLTEAANAKLASGDIVRIPAGVYKERLWPKSSGVTYVGEGRGKTIIDGAGVSYPAYTGLIYTANPGSTGYTGAPVNNLTLKGVTVQNAGACVVGYGQKGHPASTNWKLEDIEFNKCGKGFFFTADGFEVNNWEAKNGSESGGWVFDAKNWKITNFKSHDIKAAGKNTDCVTVQDASFGLIANGECWNNYDGPDIGSQKASPGSSFIIVRNVKSWNNSNTNFPSSTTITGPITFENTESWGNCNWGDTVAYEGSKNVHFWNMTIAGCTGINLTVGTKGPYFGANLRIAGANPVSGTLKSFNSNFTKVAKGVVGRLPAITASDADLVDQGGFFLKVDNKVNDYTVQTVDPRGNGINDPRTYFVVGDDIQIERAGVFKIVELTATTIKVDRVIDTLDSIGSGIHLPWSGSKPDIGCCELRKNSVDVPPPVVVEPPVKPSEPPQDTKPVTPVVSSVTADFVASSVLGNAPFLVSFTDQSKGTVGRYIWDFGDGSVSPLKNPKHTYTKAGVYTVILTVISSEPDRKSSTKNMVITVEGNLPTCEPVSKPCLFNGIEVK